MKHVAPQSHEWTANYIFDEYDLNPWFGLAKIVRDYGGSRRAEFESRGETWTVLLYYQESGIAMPPAGQTHTGTPLEMDTMREFRLKVERAPDEDPTGEQAFNAHVAPRWQGMESKGNGSNPSVPDEIEEAINVNVEGSNIEFDRYPVLLERAAEAVGLRGHYVQAQHVHSLSNVVDAARYVRIEESVAGAIHARDGPLVGLAHLLESDRTGYRKLVQNDTDERGRDLPGYYHTVTLGPKRIREAWPHHEIPKESKLYYAREAAGMDHDHDLRQPKLEAAYQTSRWDDKLHPVDDLDQLEQELDETVLSILSDAGISLRPREPGDGERDGEADTFPFRSDAYFHAAEMDAGRRLIDLNLTSIESSQESVVIQHVAGGMAESEWATLEKLITDGGQVAPADVAESEGFHLDTIYRALDSLEGLVEHDYGSISLRSEHIAKYVHEAVSEARETTKRAVEAAAKGMQAAERGVDETTSAFMAFCARHGIDVDDERDARMKLRLDADSYRERRHRVREAFRLWTAAGMDAVRFREAVVLDPDSGARTDAFRYLG